MQATEPDRVMESDLTDRIVGWVVGAAVACVAGLGLIALVIFLLVSYELPDWVGVVLGVALSLGTIAFGWLVASAVESGRKSAQESSAPRPPITRLHSRR